MQHPAHYVIEQLGGAMQHLEQQLAAANDEIARLRELVDAPAVKVEQPET